MLAEAGVDLTGSTGIGLSLALTIAGILIGYVVKAAVSRTQQAHASETNAKSIERHEKQLEDAEDGIEELDGRIGAIEKAREIDQAKIDAAREERQRMLSESSTANPRPRDRTRSYPK